MIYTPTHVYFLYSNHPFSNFYPAKFKMRLSHLDHGGRIHEFSCTEAAYMFKKAMYFDDIETANLILQETNPYEIKRLGRQVKNFDDKEWTTVRMTKMLIVNTYKYQQNPDLGKILLETGYRTLVESSSRDLAWGSGVKIDDPDLFTKEWTGNNLLGHVLGKVRALLEYQSDMSNMLQN